MTSTRAAGDVSGTRPRSAKLEVLQISAVSNVAGAVENQVLVIADGGIRFSGDIAKTVVADADCVSHRLLLHPAPVKN